MAENSVCRRACSAAVCPEWDNSHSAFMLVGNLRRSVAVGGSGRSHWRLLEELTKLPGIGPKTAERIAHFLLAGDRRNAVSLGQGPAGGRGAGPALPRVLQPHGRRTVPDLSRPAARRLVICVVETPRDVGSFERAGSYRGLYHVLGGRLAPLDGVGPEQLTIAAAARGFGEAACNEVILATNPTLEGDGTALFVSNCWPVPA